MRPEPGNVLEQMQHNEEKQRKQSSANGGRVHIYTYQLPDTDDLLAIAKEQSAKFFEIADASTNALPSPEGRQSGTIAVTSDPGGADIWVDESL